MFKLKNNIAVKIQHIHNGKNLARPIKNCNGYTIATITQKRGDLNIKLAEGIAQCNKLDQFNKRTGRIKAIGEAISNLKHHHPELYDEVKSQITLR
ncbi:MAG: hypothetical protein HC877_23120 [Thioploca sp.]|nr:hypothetical protein [Thioploca sp.]